MTTVEVNYELPFHLQTLLNSGEYLRQGRLIVSRGKKQQVMAWMRENYGNIDSILITISPASLASLFSTDISLVSWEYLLKELSKNEAKIQEIEEDFQELNLQLKINFNLSLSGSFIPVFRLINKLFSAEKVNQELAIKLSKLMEKMQNAATKLCFRYIENIGKNLENLNIIFFLKLQYLRYFAWKICLVCQLVREDIKAARNCLQRESLIVEEILHGLINIKDNQPCETLENLETKLQEKPELVKEIKFIKQQIQAKINCNLLVLHNELLESFVWFFKLEYKEIFFELALLKKLGMTWEQWKQLQPANLNANPEFIYIIPHPDNSHQ